MSKSIQLTQRQWLRLKEQLQQDYPPSVILMREKMKKVLGFVDRTHHDNTYRIDGHGNKVPHYTRMIHLDFFSEKKCTWFLMKYGDFINE